jgi:hypothetical protein
MVSSTRQSKPLTRLESDLVALIPLDGTRIDTPTLVDRYYAATAPDSRPLHPYNTIISRLRGIARKADDGKLGWRLMKTPRSGPNPQSFWRVKA